MNTVADRPIRRERTRPSSAPTSVVEPRVLALREWEELNTPGVPFHVESPDWDEYASAREAFLEELADEEDVVEPDPVYTILAQIDAENRMRETRATDREFVASLRRWVEALAPALPGHRVEACRAISGALGQLIERFEADGVESARVLLALNPDLAEASSVPSSPYA